jgi:uncharacterized protein (TIGR02118 family)
MFHVVFLVKKRPDLSQEEFTRYWIDEHTLFTAKTPGLRAYHCFPMTGHPGAPPPFDAIAYISFDDRAAYDRAMASPEFAAALADAPNFQDTANTHAFFATQHIIV